MARFIHSNMSGAPVAGQGVSGSLTYVHAALVTGFNIRTPNSVTVTAGVATFTYLAAHGYEDLQWVRVAGAGAAVLNADHQCAAPTSTTITVPAPGVPDGPVSGAIETRTAPLGWERVFEAPNISVYRSPNLTGARRYYQLNDENLGGNNYLRLRGYESMSSATVGVDPFPTIAQAAATSTEVSLVKGTATPWAVFGDDRTVYIFGGQGSTSSSILSFGDFTSFKPADAYAGFVGMSDSGTAGLSKCGGSTKNQYLCRDATGLVKSLGAARSGMTPGESGRYRAYPGAASGGVTLSRPLVQIDGAGSNTAPVRGVMRGPMYVMEQVPAYPWVIIPSVPGVTGRVAIVSDNAGAGSVGFPIDEAW